MDAEQVQKRLELLQQEYNGRLGLRGQVAQQLAELDRELERRRGGIAELQLLLQQDDVSTDA
jgi:hypothetical protein